GAGRDRPRHLGRRVRADLARRAADERVLRRPARQDPAGLRRDRRLAAVRRGPPHRRDADLGDAGAGAAQGVSENRTEAPTAKRRDEARRKGQVVRSSDINTAVVLIACVAALMLFGPGLLTNYAQMLRQGLAQTATPQLVTPDGVAQLGFWAMRSIVLLA